MLLIKYILFIHLLVFYVLSFTLAFYNIHQSDCLAATSTEKSFEALLKYIGYMALSALVEVYMICKLRQVINQDSD